MMKVGVADDYVRVLTPMSLHQSAKESEEVTGKWCSHGGVAGALQRQMAAPKPVRSGGQLPTDLHRACNGQCTLRCSPELHKREAGDLWTVWLMKQEF